MATTWTINIQQGAEFQAQVTIADWPATYPALNTATDWRLTLAQPCETAFLVATTANYITLNVAKTVGTIKIPYTVTETMPLGTATYDLDIYFPGSVRKRVISLNPVLVAGYAGGN